MAEEDIYTRLAAKVNFPKSRFIRQVFRLLVTPEEGEMLLALPATPPEFAAKYGLDEEAAAAKLDEFVRKGVSIPLTKDGVCRWFCVSSIIQVHDATIHATLNKRYEPVHDEIIEIWKCFRETEWFEVLRDAEDLGIMKGRAIPTWSAVKDDPELQPWENLRTILAQAPAIAAVDCPCRWLQVQRGTCDKPTFVCLSLTQGSVSYILEQRIGRQLTVEEGYRLLEHCEQAGLIATTSGMGNIKQLCFCETKECIILRPQVQYGYRLWQPSRFRAVPDPTFCTGCGTCTKRCGFGAVTVEKTSPRARKRRARVDAEKCFGCGVCAVTCPTGAMKMKRVRPVEHVIPAAAAQS